MEENPSRGSDRIVGVSASLHVQITDSTVDNIRKGNGIPSAPERVKQTARRQFLKAHWAGLIAADFFTTEVLSWQGLVTRVQARQQIERSLWTPESSWGAMTPQLCWLRRGNEQQSDYFSSLAGDTSG